MEATLERPKHKQKKKREKPITEKNEEIKPDFEQSTSNDTSPKDNLVLSNPYKGESTESKDCTVEEIFIPENQPCSSLKIKETIDETVKEIKQESEIIKETTKATTFDDLMLKNKTIMNTVEEINTYFNETTRKQSLIQAPVIHCTNEIRSTQETIKPYTESQLSALYSNSELEMIEHFTKNFIEHELQGNHIRQHPLYELLTWYSQNRNKVASNNLEVEQTQRDYLETQTQLWSLNSSVAKGQAQCQDGIVLQATYTYNKATFHRSSFQAIVRILAKIQQLTNESHVLYAYSAAVCKLQIDLFLHTLITTCVKLSGITKHSPICLTLCDTPQTMLAALQELRICISILFLFQRHLIRDHEFVKETRKWLRDLVAVLLRVANYQDHMFILNHVLRCPPGIGSWAASFVQMPLTLNRDESPFSSYEINHIIAVLSVLMKPIDKRDKFLEELMQRKDGPEETLWVMVESDGEEDEESSGISLRENDIVALFNQLPIDNAFRTLLCIVHKNGNDYFDGTQISEHHILRFLSFSTTLLKIIQEGILTYEQSRYNQFAKRLCRLIRHIVQYSTDIWDYFKNNNNLNDAAMLQRLQVEYDAFFLRATYCLFISKKTGAWQFLAVVPYNLISRRCLWKIFYFLHDSDSVAQSILDPIDDTDFSERLWDFSVRCQFEEKLNQLEDSESYYLLNTFANMALCRKTDDLDFIEAATHDLLHIGFISTTTQENCSKNSKILLTHITSKYPSLLSYILNVIDHNMTTVGVYALYLYEELPISIWQPNDEDIEVICRILKTNPINNDSSRWARMIISRLNWDLKGAEPFIPHKLHCKIALLVAEIVDEEPGYLPWAWQTLFRLRLHITDKGIPDFSKVYDPERYDVIRRGLREGKLIPSFLSLIMTTWGHLVPMICSDGFDQLLHLLANQKYEAVLFSLNLMVPLFLNCQESIINCDKFQQIIVGLLNADKGYLHLAKNLIGIQNQVLEQFGHLIENQILNCHQYSEVDSPRVVVRLWMNSLVSVPNWNRDFGVMYLLDVIIKSSFFFAEALDVCLNILKDLLQCSTPQEQTNTISSMFKWVSTSSNTSGGLLINSSLSSCPWLAYLIIDLEFEERERQTGLWREILAQLALQKGRINVDAAIKKAAHNLKVGSFTSGSLCFYRWAQQALDTDVDHPLLPLIWQKFFTLYLYRIPVTSNVQIGCVGSKFFEGVINFQFQKRLKRHLQECVNHYQAKFEDSARSNNEKRMFYEACYEVFRAYSLWLEEPTLQEENLYLPRLPAQCKPQLLAFIMQGNGTPWLEYVNYDMIKEQQAHSLRSWRCANYRERSNVNQPHPNPGSRVESEDPKERILKRLQSYDTPKDAPDLIISAPIVPTLNLSDKSSMFNALQQVFGTLLNFAREFNIKSAEHKSLDGGYKELVPQLYMSVPCTIKKQATCSAANKSSHCSGAAIITIEVKEARINERVQHQIETNRTSYDAVCKNVLQLPAQSLCLASVTLQETTKLLQMKLKEDKSSIEMGVELFYYILSLINDETSNYLPTKKLFSQCIDDLGKSHICGREFETPRLLNKILAEPHLGGFLAPHFSPHNSGTANFLLMYSTICKEMGQKFDTAFALLSKFDIPHWLKTKDPKLAQRSKFIDMVVRSLQDLGHDPPVESWTLHDLLRKHLMHMLAHEFPEHFGEILMVLLKASNCSMDSGYISIKVWIDFLNFLSRPVEINLSLPLRDQIRQYAQQQRLLTHAELLETSTLLCKHFTQERFQYGLYGLYPKTRYYVEVFMAFHGMIGHALVISMLNQHPGDLGDALCDMIWPYLRDMFSPWILPYSMQNVKENMANWIKQLADDRSVILPWIPSDGPSALKSVHMFFECIMFVIQTLPACGKILSFVWHWYFTNYAHSTVKDHILNVVHSSFLALPWQNFWPTIADLELMMKVSEQYLPDCHVFLGHIFIFVNWPSWLNNLMESAPMPVKIRTHQCLLNLLVKMTNEPNVHNNHTERAKTLLVQAETYDWTLIDPNMYQHITDWYVMSCDSLVLFRNDPLDLDFRILHFLYSVAHYQKSNLQSLDSFSKRHIYIRGYVKLIAVFASRYKNLISAKENNIKTILYNQLTYFERYRQQDEVNQLLETFLEVLNINGVSNIALKTFEDYIVNKSKDAVVINAFLHALGAAVCDMEAAGLLYEATLTTYFVNQVSDGKIIAWSIVLRSITFNLSKSKELEQILIGRGYVLTLHAYILRKIEKVLDYKHLLNVCLDWLSSIRISEALEPKIPLLWYDILTMAIDYSEIDEPCCGILLHRFAQVLIGCAEDKEGSKWSRSILGAIGIVKPAITVQFKFLCKALAGYILAQLPEMKGGAQTIRKTANAACTVGQPGGNTECPKILLKLDLGYTQGKIKECAEMALKEIQNPENSLHNVTVFLTKLLNQFYMKSYLRDIG